MRTAIQARLDDRSRKRLALLVRELGWTPSPVVRDGLRVLEASYLRRKRRGVIAFGKFRSGVPDLAPNKRLQLTIFRINICSKRGEGMALLGSATDGPPSLRRKP
jgi:hypothetical protein